MATTPTINASNSKTTYSPKVTSSATSSSHHSVSASSHDISSQRRIGGSGSFGAGASSRAAAAPRNNQSKKQNNKSSNKRFRLDDDAIAEQMTMRSATSRKGQTSITHLMNFSSPPRAHFGNYRNPNYRHDRRNASWSGYGTVDKTRYVHANYRFIVDPRLQYHAQSMNADDYVDWNAVLQVIASSESQADSCPICLDLAAAPRMAKCGHIFCLQCLVRFMAAEQDETKIYDKKPRSKKCPLCEESIYMSEIKSVRWYSGNEGSAPREGTDVCLRLMKRRHGSTLALPRDGAEALAEDDDIPWFYAAEVMDYAHIMKGTAEYMLEQLEGDEAALIHQENENTDLFKDDTFQSFDRALRILQEAKERIKLIKSPVDGNNTVVGSRKTRATKHEDRPEAISNMSTQHMSSLQELQHRFESSGPTSNTEFFFYQGLRHYYLSPLDIRILKQAFGSFASFPATILPRVERVSTGHVVDDDLRKRSKWLGHLPRGCEVSFLECDWTDTVPKEVLGRFSEEIERRRRRNEEKDAMEEKARLKAERDEDYLRYAHVRRRLPDEPQPSWFREDEFQSLSHIEDDGIDSNHTSATPPWGHRAAESPFNSLASMSTSPSASRTVWGTQAVVTDGDSQHRIEHLSGQDDGWLQNWESDLLHHEDDLVAQAQALSITGDQSKVSGGKKKKAKKITLMSTTVRRGA